MQQTDTLLPGAVEAAPAPHPMSGVKNKLRSLLGKVLPYSMVAPAIGVFSVFIIYPILYMVYLSFFKWNMMGPKVFIGLENFQNMFADPDFWQVLGNSFQYMFWSVTLSIAIALPLAVYLSKQTKRSNFLQSVVFTPYIVSLVSISFIWMWLMDSDYGLLNYLLSVLRIPKIGWLDDPNVALFSLILVSVWKSIGYNVIILISAMQTIPRYLYEAASLDHASGVTTFFKITLPMLSPNLFFLALMNMISSFKVFEPVKVMTAGGPLNSTNTLVYNIYQYGFEFYKIGYASALGVVLLVIIGICTIFYFKAMSRRVHYR